ncbi:MULTISPECIES: hypothetical protein [unclassified Streptomyces]|uniref:hypothetical protein n=1 Tax=unclassified Streptomyces TaxID=2593676 RepID=UPI00278C1079|nr:MULTISPECIES: hypothetical protein [unclassified Streptomyces]
MAGDADLIVNKELLSKTEKLLSTIHRDLKDINGRADDMREHWGAGEITDAMDEFADNWDNYRRELISHVESVGKMVGKTVDGFTGLDNELANPKGGKK